MTATIPQPDVPHVVTAAPRAPLPRDSVRVQGRVRTFADAALTPSIRMSTSTLVRDVNAM